MSRAVFNPGQEPAPSSFIEEKKKAANEEEADSKGHVTLKKWLTILATSKKRCDCECAICLGNFEAGSDNGQVILNCSHVFHKKCVDAFEKFNIYEVNLCPVCRSGPYQKKLVDDLEYYAEHSSRMDLDE